MPEKMKVEETRIGRSLIRPPQRMGTNWPSLTQAKHALRAGDPRMREKKGTRRRSAEAILGIAMRDAEAWRRRVDSPAYSPLPPKKFPKKRKR